MNSALIASENTVRKRSFRCRIGAPRVARRGGPGLLFVVVVALRRGDFRRRTRHAVRAGEPPRQVDRPAARRAEGERLVLLLRFHPRAAIWTAWHACLLKCGGVGFNKRDSGQPQDGRLTAWQYHFMTRSNGGRTHARAGGPGRGRRPGHPPDARVMLVYRGLRSPDGLERTGGPRRPSSAEARMHPARSDDAG